LEAPYEQIPYNESALGVKHHSISLKALTVLSIVLDSPTLKPVQSSVYLSKDIPAIM